MTAIQPPAAPRYARIFTVACYAASAAILVFLFCQNFFFSTQIGRIASRGVDDLAFQLVLRSVHTAMDAGNFARLWIINDYAYGWIYWSPLAVLSYPLYWLSVAQGIDWPLVAFPRQASLLFTLGGAYYLRKIVARLGGNEAACAGAVLMYLFYPATAFFSMRFGTVAAISFFSILSVHLLLRNEAASFRATAPAVLALAVAGAIKLSGLLISPLLLLLIVKRLQGVKLARALAMLFALGATFAVAIALLTNPAFLIAPLHPVIWTDYLAILTHFMQVTQESRTTTGMFQRFYNAVFFSWPLAAAMALLLVGLVIQVRRGGRNRFACASAIAALGMAAAYLIFGVKADNSAGSYFTAVAFLLAIGVVGWLRSATGAVVMVLIFGLMTADAMLRIESQIRQANTEPFRPNLAAYLIQAIKSRDIERRSDFIENCIANDSAGKPFTHIFYDYQSPPPFNPLTMPQACFSVAWDNLSPAGVYCGGNPVQYVLLSLPNLGFSAASVFEERVAGLDAGVAERMRQDREVRRTLVEQGTFGDQRFARLCEGENVVIFKAMN